MAKTLSITLFSLYNIESSNVWFLLFFYFTNLKITMTFFLRFVLFTRLKIPVLSDHLRISSVYFPLKAIHHNKCQRSPNDPKQKANDLIFLTWYLHVIHLHAVFSVLFCHDHCSVACILSSLLSTLVLLINWLVRYFRCIQSGSILLPANIDSNNNRNDK